MKCYRVLYKPDNTAFMVWGHTKSGALLKAMARNDLELNNEDEREYAWNEELYIIDEFTPDTNRTGILAFYDCYEVYERKGVTYNNRIN